MLLHAGWHGHHERGGQKQNRRLRLGKSITATGGGLIQQRITSIFQNNYKSHKYEGASLNRVAPSIILKFEEPYMTQKIF